MLRFIYYILGIVNPILFLIYIGLTPVENSGFIGIGLVLLVLSFINYPSKSFIGTKSGNLSFTINSVLILAWSLCIFGTLFPMFQPITVPAFFAAITFQIVYVVWFLVTTVYSWVKNKK
jgi:hypothetical protein